jgi:L-fuconolactonase
LLARAGVSRTVLVQAACSDADTDSMFERAARHDWIGGVIAWVDLRSPERARERLDELSHQPKLRGVRHLIHDEPDPHWILQDAVLESLALLEERGLILELPCVYPRHLGDVPRLAERFPALTIVVDHLGKPPIGTPEMQPWADLLLAAGRHANVAAKLSGLNTALTASDWDAEDLREPVEVALDAFGPERLVCGSDWPVALLNGDYARVWRETVRVIEDLAPAHAERLLAENAVRLYALEAA